MATPRNTRTRDAHARVRAITSGNASLEGKESPRRITREQRDAIVKGRPAKRFPNPDTAVVDRLIGGYEAITGEEFPKAGRGWAAYGYEIHGPEFPSSARSSRPRAPR